MCGAAFDPCLWLQVRQLVLQLVQGVQYLHDLSVWHRDLKSANCLLKNEAGRTVVKIADLGALSCAALLAHCLLACGRTSSARPVRPKCMPQLLCVCRRRCTSVRACTLMIRLTARYVVQAVRAAEQFQSARLRGQSH